MSEEMDRIEASRARIRLAMSPPVAPPPNEQGGPSAPSWLHRLGEVPLVSAVVDSVSTWWSHHPLRSVAQIANDASAAIARPVAQRNPMTLVLVAAVVGAGLAWSRPWRWIFRSALFAGLVPQLVTRVASSLPIESWMSMAGAAMSQRPPPARTEARRPAPTA